MEREDGEESEESVATGTFGPDIQEEKKRNEGFGGGGRTCRQMRAGETTCDEDARKKLRNNFTAIQLFSWSMSMFEVRVRAEFSSSGRLALSFIRRTHRGKILATASAVVASANRTHDSIDFILSQPYPEDYYLQSNKCTTRLHTSLEKLRRRQANLKSTAFIDLSGYALHQTLRHVPLDMYVTDIRVKTPGVGDWVRIQKCQFSNRDNRMTTQILFNDMTVSGTVQLLDDTEVLKNSLHPVPRELCKMSLRLQRAGLGINAFPTTGRSRGLEVRTEARFMDPKFLSVHAYGCKLNEIFKRSDEGKLGEAQISENQTEPSRLPQILRRHRSDDGGSSEEGPEVRIITLNPDLRTSEDVKWISLHREKESDANDFHRQRILSTKLHAATERDKLNAVLHIKNLIAQQTNHVFQTQGPFSQNQPVFKPHRQTFPNRNPKPGNGHNVVGIITELDENLSPIRPVPQRPFEALFRPGEHIVNHSNHPVFNHYYEEVSKEMEEIFLRGIKTLLAKYVEKQLEIPLKEALMVNYGYTVSYG